MQWIRTIDRLPKSGQVVETKVEDKDGIRNVQLLKLSRTLWFVPDGSSYVYYRPTHWREKQ